MYRAVVKLPADYSEEQVACMGEALDGLSAAHTALRENNNDNGRWIVEWIIPEKPPEAELTARLILQAETHGLTLPETLWRFEPIPEDFDWLTHSYQQFPPFSIGPFFIYGSHYDGDVPGAQIGLQIDAATAFGSGEHGSTRGCLEAMLDLKGRGACPWNVLDMGTGSGILAIAAWKLWKTPVLAVDNDAEALRVAEHHRAVNKIPAGATDLSCVQGDGFKTGAVQQKKPFDLIIANILAGPLKDMAADLQAVADENGYVVLSGILNTQAADVAAAYKAHGFTQVSQTQSGDWSTLLLQNAAA